ncbi:MAG: CotH kinase family protein [Flavobacteriales bacterium]|nr:CotH kinase family protein [Flavobacteriales bacterium]MBP9080975.1 CotH kinase family protein [Flavobacteriales bacterium]
MFPPIQACKATALFILLPTWLAAQTFNGSGGSIPDDGNALEIPLDVAGLPATMDTTAFGLEQVCFTIDHDWIADLDVSLVSPDGTARLLTSGQGGDTDHYTNTCLRQDAPYSIVMGLPPFSETFRPMQDIGQFNNGQSGNGQWKLRVLDVYPFGDAGSVLNWSITFGNNPASPFHLASSNLPIVLINTNGQAIPNDVKITAFMGIVDNGAGNLNHPGDPYTDYGGDIGIEVRGNTSDWLSPKKSYSVELRDAFGEDLDAPLLGMPAESDWTLLASYFDKSLLNNTLTFHLARAMGRYAPRTRDVEVVLNGEYLGVFNFVERIKRGPHRVDIAKLQPDETFGDDLTGGYILSVDRDNGPVNGFASPFPPAESGNGQTTYFEHRYPKGEDLAPEQRAYIQAYVDSFETALHGPSFTDSATGYQAYADVGSFVDLFLLNELSRNVDGYRLSGYLYKDKLSNGGKLHAGPAWDFDLGWGNANYCQGADTAGWQYLMGDFCPNENAQVPFWWPRLMEDSNFVNTVRCRWEALRDNVLSPGYVAAFCDSVAAVLDQAQQRNFEAWPILGEYVWPNPVPVPATYAGEIQELKHFMNGRWAWLDANLPGSCGVNTAIGTATAPVGAPYPNPFLDAVRFHTTTGEAVMVRLTDAVGRTVHTAGPFMGQGSHHVFELPLGLAPGTYLFTATGKSGARSTFRLQH